MLDTPTLRFISPNQTNLGASSEGGRVASVLCPANSNHLSPDLWPPPLRPRGTRASRGTGSDSPGWLSSLTVTHSWGPKVENGCCTCVVFSRCLKRRSPRGAAYSTVPQRGTRALTRELGKRCNWRSLQSKVHVLPFVTYVPWGRNFETVLTVAPQTSTPSLQHGSVVCTQISRYSRPPDPGFAF